MGIALLVEDEPHIRRFVRLTPTEHRLLAVLVANAGKVMTTPQLLRNVWGPNQADHAHYLRIYMGATHIRAPVQNEQTFRFLRLFATLADDLVSVLLAFVWARQDTYVSASGRFLFCFRAP